MADHVKNHYLNRELSWIEFNARVLAEAMDETNPVLERLKFLGIVSSNFDEFFMVRVASLIESDPVFVQVYQKAFELMTRQGNYFKDVLVPELEKSGIRRLLPHQLTDRQREFVENLFQKEIVSLLTPIAIQKDRPLPLLLNLRLYIVVELLEPKEKTTGHFAVIEVPKNYPRMINLPTDEGYPFILIEDLIAMYMKELFQGYEVIHHGLLRVTRGAELSLDEEKDEDFAKVMSEALRIRRGGEILRMETAVPLAMAKSIQKLWELPDQKIFQTQAWMDLKGIAQLASQPIYENLKRPAWIPQHIPEIEESEDLWAVLREKDVLIHYPYESFDSFMKFLSQAATDPDVLAIKQTLYRTGRDSRVIRLLRKAAESGKQVTVLIELKARFDEEENIEGAKQLESSGVTVLYGVAGLKTHAKACLVIRREQEGIRRYAHLSTGNYNEKTAQIYSDLGLFTSDNALTRDLATFFNIITGYSNPVGFSKIEIAPFGLRRKLERLILREAMAEGASGLIMAKLNSLVDPEIIEALYRASQKGVKIKLNVRGVCCLVPGIKGVSENIEVTSIVDMFLEHARIFYFRNNGDEEVYLSSADWMPRNLNRRLEILFPISHEKHKRNLIELLKNYFKDNVKSWGLTPDGTYIKNITGEKRFRVQEVLSKMALEKREEINKTGWKDLKPQRPKVQVEGGISLEPSAQKDSDSKK